jgi:hypothetical protein
MRNLQFSFALFLTSLQANAQHTFVPPDADAESLIQRYEIRTGTFRNSLFTDTRPYSLANLAEMTKLFNVSRIGVTLIQANDGISRHFGYRT